MTDQNWLCQRACSLIPNGFHEIGHSGATAGYRGWLAYYPAKQLSVVLLSNDGRFNPGGWKKR